MSGAGAAISASLELGGSTARINRDMTVSGTITASADSNIVGVSNSMASQNGGFGSLLVDQQVADALGLTNLGIPTVPAFVDILDASSSEADVALPTLGFAAAISLNFAQPATTAEIGNNTSVASTGDSVFVRTSVLNPLTTNALASSVANSANIGMALSGNVPGGTNRARIGDNASVVGETVEVTAGGSPQLLSAGAAAGAGGIVAGVAGAVAVNAGVPNQPNTTQVTIGGTVPW